MHVGLSVFFQNLVAGQSDAGVYDQELALADLAEPLGFDSVWAAEHPQSHPALASCGRFWTMAATASASKCDLRTISRTTSAPWVG